MKDILKVIGDYKREETSRKRKKISIDQLMASALANRQCLSLAANLHGRTNPAIIAEFKRKSPSKGIIREKAEPMEIATAYREAGASAVSVLTDMNFFGAQPDDFALIRRNLEIPLLRKDFILEEYQVFETRAMGADIMLLIAAMLSPDEVKNLSGIAREMGMDVLLELHSEKELGHLCDGITLAGINNRNLDTFEVDIENSKKMISMLPADIPKVAESGLKSPAEIKELHKAGFDAFLIGETFMKAGDPGQKCRELINELNKT